MSIMGRLLWLAGTRHPERSAPPARRPDRARHSKNPALGRSASPVCHRPPTTPVTITSVTAPRGSVVQARSRPIGCHRPVTGPEGEARPSRGPPSRSSLAVVQMRQPRGRKPAASVGGHPAGRSASRAENAQNWRACVPPPAQPVRLPAAPIRRSGAAPPYESLTVSDPFSASAARASPPFCTRRGVELGVAGGRGYLGVLLGCFWALVSRELGVTCRGGGGRPGGGACGGGEISGGPRPAPCDPPLRGMCRRRVGGGGGDEHEP